MLKEAILASGLALANAGMKSLFEAGTSYFMDPCSGVQRRALLRKDATSLLSRAAEIAESAMRELGRDTKRLRRRILRTAQHVELPLLRRKRRTALGLAAELGLSIGAVLMYFLDPQRGHERRDALRARLRHMRSTFHDVRNRPRDGVHPAPQPPAPSGSPS